MVLAFLLETTGCIHVCVGQLQVPATCTWCHMNYATSAATGAPPAPQPWCPSRNDVSWTWSLSITRIDTTLLPHHHQDTHAPASASTSASLRPSAP